MKDLFLNMSNIEEIAMYIIKLAKEEKLSVTLTAEPGRTEIQVYPWNDVVVHCPYDKKE